MDSIHKQTMINKYSDKLYIINFYAENYFIIIINYINMDASKHMEMLRKYIAPGKVFIFSASYCPYCVQAKDLFTNLGVQYKAVEVDRSNGFPNSFINFINQHANIDTYPKIYIGEQCIGGYSDAKLLLDNNQLLQKLQAEGISYTEAK